MIADSELLGRYATQKTEADFAELVRRHLNLVYSAALRQVRGDVHLAKDVTQSVFNDLSRKAGSLRHHAVLSGWLYTSTRYAALQLVRAESRRKLREQEAQTMNELTKSEEVTEHWDSLRPVLDEVMHGLGGRDREAVLLRFFEGQPFQAIGARLGLSEDAARKRVERALETLRGALEKRGVTSTAAALAVLLTESGVVAAPAGLGAVVTSGALGSGGGLGVEIWRALAGMGTLATVAIVLVIGGTAAAISEHQTGRQLEAELDSLGAENGRLVQARADGRLAQTVPKLEAEWAASPRATPEGLGALPTEDKRSAAQRNHDERMTNDPAYRERTRDSLRRSYDRSYAGLCRALALPPDELERFISFMMDAELADADARRLARTYGIELKTNGEYDALKTAATEDILSEMKGMLGAEKFAYYQNYESTVGFRATLSGLSEQLRRTESALSDRQLDYAANLIGSAGRDPDAKLGTDAYYPIPDMIIAKLEAVWTPEQIEALRGVQAGQKARREMVQMNRKAATKGQLRLNEQSLKDYAKPAAAVSSKS